MTSTPPDLSSLRIRRDDGAPRRRGVACAILPAAIVVPIGAIVVWLLVLAPGRAISVRAPTVSATGGGSVSSEGISAKILGRLASLRVHEGSHLNKGEIIATIESPDYEAQLGAARAAEVETQVQLEQANRDLQRARELRKGGLNSDLDLENAQTRVDVLAAQLRARAPAAGSRP